MTKTSASKQIRLCMAIALWSAGMTAHAQHATVVKERNAAPALHKIRDFIIYRDSVFHCAFPSLIKKKDGSYLLAFRRAPERRVLGERVTTHVDPNSYLVQLTSKDGLHWPAEPGLLYAHPFGGSQDPCLLQLSDGTILCASYGWSFPNADALTRFKTPYFKAANAVFLGGYLLRSADNGRSWSAPVYPPAVPAEVHYSPYGNKLPAYNRGALCEGRNGTIYWAVAATDDSASKKTSNYLLTSKDGGKSWAYQSVIAKDTKISFNETSIYETPGGDLVAFMRTANAGDTACIARSKDGGKTFRWEPMGFKGHPLQALRLPDNRVLVTYGYRHAPHGIRARVLDAECTDFKTAKEFVIRADATSGDIGYPWAVMLDRQRILLVYYYNINDGPRSIEATLLEYR
ncbi:glycoside hydrolase [Niabella sp. CC-SYL272]|uniref:sialidase family protein n=1 Tax=Niabella agricola TaxID=2891571 RepID=UPI001F1901E6|nr:sialidase family protein [Niabella agricola]MCF3110239.1 glycoside hydrolase [Niabella agricola]